MKRIEGSCIQVNGLHHYDGGQIIYGENTIENARKTIDDSNARRMREGWIKKPDQYLICRLEWVRYENDDGTFLKSEECVSVIEKYPA